jgi:membrane-bound ClpP family serine protease
MMIGLSIWDLLGFLGFIFLIIFFYTGKNSVWGLFTAGIIIAAIVGLILFLKDGYWPWELFKRIIVVATLAGVAIEVVNRIAELVKKRRRDQSV